MAQHEDFDPVEWGRVLAKLDSIDSKVDTMRGEVDDLKKSMHTGWGLLIGAVAILGLFANELLDGFKRLIGMGVH
jgi:tetrahydromethanopterin S-methyltransferase subunit G